MYTTKGNTMFGKMDALLAHGMVRYFKPSRVVEVGSGQSSRVTVNGIIQNEKLDGSLCALKILEPKPGRLPLPLQTGAVFTDRGLKSSMTFKQIFMEQDTLGTYTALQADDILFIDSSHRIGLFFIPEWKLPGPVLFTDLLMFFTEIIPRLNAGVVIHVHDIPFPVFAWYSARTDPRQTSGWKPAAARGWTEQFMLHALLAFNPYLEVLHFGGIYAEGWADANDFDAPKRQRLKDGAGKAMPERLGGQSNKITPFAFGGSAWIRRTELAYPDELDPLLATGSKADRDAIDLDTLLHRKRAWVGWNQPTWTGVDTVTAAVQKLGAASPKSIMLVGSSPVATAMSAAAPAATAVKVSTMGAVTMDQFLGLGENDVVVYSVAEESKVAPNSIHKDHGIIEFVVEMLPRIPPGVVVVVRGIAYPLAYGLNKQGKAGTTHAAQFILQAFGIHNSEFEMLWAEGAAAQPGPPNDQSIIIRRKKP